MTPEERAEKIISDESWRDIDYIGRDGDEQMIDTIDLKVLRDQIAAAIRAGVEAERERIRATVLAIQADWPDVFTGDNASAAARHALDRVLALLDATHP